MGIDAGVQCTPIIFLQRKQVTTLATLVLSHKSQVGMPRMLHRYLTFELLHQLLQVETTLRLPRNVFQARSIAKMREQTLRLY